MLNGELLERAQALPLPQQWELVEQLDPDISHFEFFLSAQPIEPAALSDDALLQAHGLRQPCLWGEPDPILGTKMEPLQLSNDERELLQRLQEQPDAPLGTLADPSVIRRLVDRRLVLLQA